jgi:hypothetical protein
MRCSACKSDVTPVPPRTMAKLGLVGFYIAALVVSTIFSLLLGLNILLAPAAIVVGMAVGVAARRANEWSCPQCKEEMRAPAAEPTPAMAERPLVPRVV